MEQKYICNGKFYSISFQNFDMHISKRKFAAWLTKHCVVYLTKQNSFEYQKLSSD